MVGTFPLNVQAGSPQYTIVNQITPNTSSSLWIHNPDYIRPVNNAYYTIQNADGTKWCTFYVSYWGQDPAGDYETTISEWSSSNTSDVFPKGSLCWCIWCKEYYDSLTTPISTTNNEISTINNGISTINNEIDVLTPKVDNSFVNATKTDDTTLRLTRNDGTTVDISFPKGLKVRTISNELIDDISAGDNELVVINSCSLKTKSPGNTDYYIRGGLGYLKDINQSDNITISDSNFVIKLDAMFGVDVSGLLYNNSKLYHTP